MFGIPINGPADVFCDNQGVVKNTSLLESVLSKKHNVINYHVVREAVAAGIMRVAKEDGETNLADLERSLRIDGYGLRFSIRFRNFETSLRSLTFDETVLLDPISRSLIRGVGWNFCLCQADHYININHRSGLLPTHKRHDAGFNRFLHHFAFAARKNCKCSGVCVV